MWGEDGRVVLYLLLQKISFWTTAFNLDVALKDGGKMFCKDLDYSLAEIYLPGISQLFFGKPEYRVKDGEGERDR